MDELPIVAHGAWPSPITAALLVEGAAGVSEVRADGTDVWWNEQPRPRTVGRPCGGPPGCATTCSHRGTPTIRRRPGTPVWRCSSTAAGPGRCVAGGVRQPGRPAAVPGRPGAHPVPITPGAVDAPGLRWSEPVWLDDGWLVLVRSPTNRRWSAHGEAMNEVSCSRSTGGPSTTRLVGSSGPVLIRAHAGGVGTGAPSRGSAGTTPACPGTALSWWSPGRT